jgi:hypothetical protein
MNLLKILWWDLTHQSLLVTFVALVYSGNICLRDMDGYRTLATACFPRDWPPDPMATSEGFKK